MRNDNGETICRECGEVLSVENASVRRREGWRPSFNGICRECESDLAMERKGGAA